MSEDQPPLPPVTTAIPGEDEPLVMAIPRRELWGVAGVVKVIPMPVLEAIQDEAWYGTPSQIVQDLDAKQLRLGLLIVRSDAEGRQALVSVSGVLMQCMAVGILAGERPGSRLRTLRELAAQEACLLIGQVGVRVELVGLMNIDQQPELRPFALLVYRVMVPGSAAAPPGMNWVSLTVLAGMALDPGSQHALGLCHG